MSKAADRGPEFALPVMVSTTNSEAAQIISATGWHLAWVELSPHREIAAYMTTCINLHDELVGVLNDAAGILHQLPLSKYPDEVACRDRIDNVLAKLEEKQCE